MAKKVDRVAAAVAAILCSGGIGAAQAQGQGNEERLARDVEALKAEVKALREQGRAQPSSPPAGSGLSTSVGGVSLTLYGTANVDAGTVERTGATAITAPLNSLVGAPGAAPVNQSQRTTLRSNSSNVGLRGSRALGAGIGVTFQVESALGLDGNASTLAGRDTFIGLTSPYGTLLYGSNMDSPYKRGVQDRDPFFATGVATQKGILGSPGFNVSSVNAVSGVTVGGNAAGAQQQNAGFDARLNNLIVYRSPTINGLSAEIAHGLNEQRSSSSGVQIDPRVLSLQVRYVFGPLFSSVAYERRSDVFGLNSLTALNAGTGVTGAAFVLTPGADSRDTASKVGLGARLGAGTDVLLVWESLKYTTNVGPVSSFDRDAWIASLSQKLGMHRAIVSYGLARDGACSLAAGGACSTAGLGATQWSIGYDYTVDTHTNLYVFGTRIRNDDAAAYNFGVSGAPAAGVGADPTAIALGIRYRF
jgi:predicted porin